MQFRLLEVNLSTREKKVVDVTQDFRQYLGGRGYGGKLLWERVPEVPIPLEKKIFFILGWDRSPGSSGSNEF